MLSLCMIVKNEEEYLGRALTCVRDIVNEMVVVDTGSTDGTMDIAKEFGARVFKYEWNNDFSAAKNYAISKASGDWILSLDADEIIAKRDLQEIVKLIEINHSFGYKLIQRNYTNKTNITGWMPNPMDYQEGNGYAGYFPSPLVRLFRNDNRIRFQGLIHEIVEPVMENAGLPFQDTNIPIHHYGMSKGERRFNQKICLYAELEEKKARQKTGDILSLVRAASLYNEVGEFDKAAGLLKEVLHHMPDCAGAYHELAMLHEKKGELSAAEGFYLRAISCGKGKDLFLYNYNTGNFLKKRGRIDESLKYLLKASEINPKHFNTHYQLGEIFFSKGNLSSAIKHFREVIRIYPNHSQARHNIGVIYYHMGNKRLAAEEFQAAIHINPEYGKARYHLAILYAESERTEEARRELETFLQYDPGNAEALKVLEVLR